MSVNQQRGTIPAHQLEEDDDGIRIEKINHPRVVPPDTQFTVEVDVSNIAPEPSAGCVGRGDDCCRHRLLNVGWEIETVVTVPEDQNSETLCIPDIGTRRYFINILSPPTDGEHDLTVQTFGSPSGTFVGESSSVIKVDSRVAPPEPPEDGDGGKMLVIILALLLVAAGLVVV